MTLTQQLLEAVKAEPWATATQIAKQLYNDRGTGNWGTVSSLLNRLTKRGLLSRVKGHGPRGGYGYAIAGQHDRWGAFVKVAEGVIEGPTAWERLDTLPF